MKNKDTDLQVNRFERHWWIKNGRYFEWIEAIPVTPIIAKLFK